MMSSLSVYGSMSISRAPFNLEAQSLGYIGESLCGCKVEELEKSKSAEEIKGLHRVEIKIVRCSEDWVLSCVEGSKRSRKVMD